MTHTCLKQQQTQQAKKLSGLMHIFHWLKTWVPQIRRKQWSWSRNSWRTKEAQSFIHWRAYSTQHNSLDSAHSWWTNYRKKVYVFILHLFHLDVLQAEETHYPLLSIHSAQPHYFTTAQNRALSSLFTPTRPVIGESKLAVQFSF